MISNNDIVELSIIEYYYDRYQKCLYNNALHNCNFNEFTIQLRYFFVWSYKTNCPECISFVVNRHIV